MSQHRIKCKCCGCLGCGGTYPEELRVTLAGAVPGECGGGSTLRYRIVGGDVNVARVLPIYSLFNSRLTVVYRTDPAGVDEYAPITLSIEECATGIITVQQFYWFVRIESANRVVVALNSGPVDGSEPSGVNLQNATFRVFLHSTDRAADADCRTFPAGKPFRNQESAHTVLIPGGHITRLVTGGTATLSTNAAGDCCCYQLVQKCSCLFPGPPYLYVPKTAQSGPFGLPTAYFRRDGTCYAMFAGSFAAKPSDEALIIDPPPSEEEQCIPCLCQKWETVSVTISGVQFCQCVQLNSGEVLPRVTTEASVNGSFTLVKNGWSSTLGHCAYQIVIPGAVEQRVYQTLDCSDVPEITLGDLTIDLVFKVGRTSPECADTDSALWFEGRLRAYASGGMSANFFDGTVQQACTVPATEGSCVPPAAIANGNFSNCAYHPPGFSFDSGFNGSASLAYNE